MEIVQTMNSDPGLAVGEALLPSPLITCTLLSAALASTLRSPPPPGEVFSVGGRDVA